ncbi:hypothetical protein [Nocardia sp. NPDC057227]|uniref:hypothetical protein n=1 Tax=Nocardia sp. NPDC057227 TaxID=3346056 RepID=UPI003628D4E3
MVVKMLSEYWAALLVGAAVGFVVGVVTLLLLGFRRVHRGDRTLIVPELDRRSVGERLRGWRDRAVASPLRPRAFVAIVALAVATVVAGLVQNTLFNLHQTSCNADFQSTTLELRQIATKDRELENRDDGLRNTRDDLMSTLVKALASPPPLSDPQAYTQRLLQDYNTAVAALDVERNKLIAERKDLEDQRKAQPAPQERC